VVPATLDDVGEGVAAAGEMGLGELATEGLADDADGRATLVLLRLARAWLASVFDTGPGVCLYAERTWIQGCLFLSHSPPCVKAGGFGRPVPKEAM